MRAAHPQVGGRLAGHEDLGLLAGQGERNPAPADGDLLAGVEGIEEFGAIGFADLRIEGDIAIGGIQRHQGFFLIQHAAECIGAGSAA